MGRHRADAKHGNVEIRHDTRPPVDVKYNPGDHHRLYLASQCSEGGTLHDLQRVLPAPQNLPADLFPRRRWWIAQTCTAAATIGSTYGMYITIQIPDAGLLTLLFASMALLGLGQAWMIRLTKRQDRR